MLRTLTMVSSGPRINGPSAGLLDFLKEQFAPQLKEQEIRRGPGGLPE
jgi:hypothetical protein